MPYKIKQFIHNFIESIDKTWEKQIIVIIMLY